MESLYGAVPVTSAPSVEYPGDADKEMNLSIKNYLRRRRTKREATARYQRGRKGGIMKGLKSGGTVLEEAMLGGLWVLQFGLTLCLSVVRFLWWGIWTLFVVGVVWLWIQNPELVQDTIQWIWDTMKDWMGEESPFQS